jgi:hypothetical protein
MAVDEFLSKVRGVSVLAYPRPGRATLNQSSELNQVAKVGRNDPCPCGNGEKYKKCHGSPLLPVVPVGPTTGQQPSRPPFSFRELTPHEITPELRRMQAEATKPRLNPAFIRQFGQVRPPISMDYLGYKLVIAGNKVVYQPKEQAQFFTDILLTFVPNTFGREWFEAEVAKPRGTRHPIFEARFKGMSYMNAQPLDTQGARKAQMTGPMMKYFTFAYDLFTVQDNGRLDTRLIERLKNCDQFQGARHELFAEATCLRAGFSIEHEDETDGSTRHAEFTATHKATGQQVSVETKSKHRPGVLGFPGERQAEGEHKLNVGQLLNDAIRKNRPHPLVVFFDLNLPWSTASRFWKSVSHSIRDPRHVGSDAEEAFGEGPHQPPRGYQSSRALLGRRGSCPISSNSQYPDATSRQACRTTHSSHGYSSGREFLR